MHPPSGDMLRTASGKACWPSFSQKQHPEASWLLMGHPVLSNLGKQETNYKCINACRSWLLHVSSDSLHPKCENNHWRQCHTTLLFLCPLRRPPCKYIVAWIIFGLLKPPLLWIGPSTQKPWSLLVVHIGVATNYIKRSTVSQHELILETLLHSWIQQFNQTLFRKLSQKHVCVLKAQSLGCIPGNAPGCTMMYFIQTVW